MDYAPSEREARLRVPPVEGDARRVGMGRCVAHWRDLVRRGVGRVAPRRHVERDVRIWTEPDPSDDQKHLEPARSGEHNTRGGNPRSRPILPLTGRRSPSSMWPPVHRCRARRRRFGSGNVGASAFCTVTLVEASTPASSLADLTAYCPCQGY